MYIPEELIKFVPILDEVIIDFLEKGGEEASILLILPTRLITHLASRYLCDKLESVWQQDIILNRHLNTVKKLDSQLRIHCCSLEHIREKTCGLPITSLYTSRDAFYSMRKLDAQLGGDNIMEHLMSRLRSPQGHTTKVVIM